MSVATQGHSANRNFPKGRSEKETSYGGIILFFLALWMQRQIIWRGKQRINVPVDCLWEWQEEEVEVSRKDTIFTKKKKKREK